MFVINEGELYKFILYSILSLSAMLWHSELSVSIFLSSISKQKRVLKAPPAGLLANPTNLHETHGLTMRTQVVKTYYPFNTRQLKVV